MFADRPFRRRYKAKGSSPLWYLRWRWWYLGRYLSWDLRGGLCNGCLVRRCFNCSLLRSGGLLLLCLLFSPSPLSVLLLRASAYMLSLPLLLGLGWLLSFCFDLSLNTFCSQLPYPGGCLLVLLLVLLGLHELRGLLL